MGATLDALTGGRFILGIGAGYYQDDYRQYGYKYPTPAVRIRQLEEGLQIIKRLWTEDNVTFKGTYFQVENAYCNPKPNPVPPIMVAGIGEQLSIKLVAKYADWWNIPFPTVERYRHKLEVLKRHCMKIGRNPDTLVKTQLQFVSVAETDEKAKILFHNSLYGRRFRGISGSPQTVTRKMKEHIDIGVDYFILWFTPFPNLKNTMMFAEEIMPALRDHF
jgi:alkanesulfonate monooxygenase SsuD/methylene tetrahydromethanopterin reductase-like flavin-dependent oxidoreductase (luciferase family)